jgi:hypothetical protein
MAFLVAGGVTSSIAVFALVKKPVFALYVAFALSGSLVWRLDRSGEALSVNTESPKALYLSDFGPCPKTAHTFRERALTLKAARTLRV